MSEAQKTPAEAAQSKESRRPFNANVTFLLCVAAVGAGVFTYLTQQPWIHARTSDAIGMGALPIIFAGAVTLLPLAEAIRLMITGRKKAAKKPEEQEPMLPMLLLTAVTVIGAFGLWYFDAIISVTLVLFALLLIGRIRDWRLLVGVPVISAVVIYFLFVRLLGVYFPTGWFR